jgi:hypothetical protein
LYAGNPGTDGLQFKSVLIRHLRYLIDSVVRAHGGDTAAAAAAIAAAGGNLSTWHARVYANADSIWERAACAPHVPLAVGAAVRVPALFGFLWRGPCSWAFGGPSATTQTSALDVFTAAMALQQPRSQARARPRSDQADARMAGAASGAGSSKRTHAS